MVVADYFPVPTPISLAVVLSILAVTIIISMIVTKKRSTIENQK